MSNLVDYAKDELKRIGMIDSGEPYNDWVTKAILDLIEVFASQGHSNFSASYVVNMFHRLAMFKPASPLTGEDDEWKDIGGGVLQNKRYSAVFKDKDGTVYNSEGKVFTDDGEVWYTCKDSMVNVTFPYVVPDKPEYIYRNKEVEDELSKLPPMWIPVTTESLPKDGPFKKHGLIREQEPCEDAISRQAVLDLIEHYNSDGLGSVFYGYEQGVKFADAVNKLPPVNPQEPKTGHWIKVYQGDEIINYRCSECELGDTNGSTNLYGWDYCRRCGARMVEPQERSDDE